MINIKKSNDYDNYFHISIFTFFNFLFNLHPNFEYQPVFAAFLAIKS